MCRTEAAWKMTAEAACMAKGLTLANISYSSPCKSATTPMGGYAEVNYECCSK